MDSFFHFKQIVMIEIKNTIEQAWDNREMLREPKVQEAIRELVDLLDKGKVRVAEPSDAGLKKVLSYISPYSKWSQ